jgi:hypothetical protein
MIVIGVSGAQRAGKDTVASYLVERHGFTRIGLADPLKHLAGTIDPIVDGTLGIRMNELLASYGEDYVKANYPEYRRFLINLGQGLRSFDEDFWVDALLGSIVNLQDDYGLDRFVVPDIRFENEVASLRRLREFDRQARVEVWKVCHNKAEAAARETGQVTERLFEPAFNHLFDRQLNNNQEIPFLHMQVRGAILQIAKEMAA